MSQADPIIITGARTHQLKNVTLSLPRNQFIVITGVSGSGKSSLAIDTLFAEGQRRYAESLTAYARQFLPRMEKPDVTQIQGLSPTIAITQKVSSVNPRSTVGTLTDIYEYLKILFAKIGKTFSPLSGKEVKKATIASVIDFVQTLSCAFVVVSVRLERTALSLETFIPQLHNKGIQRIVYQGAFIRLEEALRQNILSDAYDVVLDRIALDDTDLPARTARLREALENAFFEGNGYLRIITSEGQSYDFSNQFVLDGMTFSEPSADLFSFNNPLGACPRCEGYGNCWTIDYDLVLPDKNLTLYDGAIAPWRMKSTQHYQEQLCAAPHGLPLFKPVKDFSPEEWRLLLHGNAHFEGLESFFNTLKKYAYKPFFRLLLARYKRKSLCPDCQGCRLRAEALYVRVGDKNIAELVRLPASGLYEWFQQLQLSPHETNIARRLLQELHIRLQTLINVGLGYLSLHRAAHTLSGGESQRIQLTLSLGNSLSDTIYILDEPSIGLHPQDTARLIEVLQALQQLGNTVVVIEHDAEMMQSADYLVEMGPLAGHLGGSVVAAGTLRDLLQNPQSLTGAYLKGEKKVHLDKSPRIPEQFITLKNAQLHNLKNVSVAIPLGVLCVVCGVSGSGKSSLIRGILYESVKNYLNGDTKQQKQLLQQLGAALKNITHIEMVDQNPIGKSTRSNPVSYIGAFELIRQLFSEQALSRQRKYSPGTFSYNVSGGRCAACEGLGVERIEMQFLSDMFLICEHCGGKRYQEAVLEVCYRDKNIFEVLEMTIDEAVVFFNKRPLILQKLQPLLDVGLGYLRLGQASSTLSGGEAQRIKLAHYLSIGSAKYPHLFIFDEPTTGLHFADIQKLLYAFEQLIRNGHSVISIEHNTEVIKNADWVIELGPGAGDKGGTIIFEGTPQELKQQKNSPTAPFL